jgi:hypothetical protein
MKLDAVDSWTSSILWNKFGVRYVTKDLLVFVFRFVAYRAIHVNIDSCRVSRIMDRSVHSLSVSNLKGDILKAFKYLENTSNVLLCLLGVRTL